MYWKNKNFLSKYGWNKICKFKIFFLTEVIKKEKKKKGNNHLIKANNISSSISNRFHNFSSHKGDIQQP